MLRDLLDSRLTFFRPIRSVERQVICSLDTNSLRNRQKLDEYPTNTQFQQRVREQKAARTAKRSKCLHFVFNANTHIKLGSEKEWRRRGVCGGQNYLPLERLLSLG